jgi:hypothetical protein
MMDEIINITPEMMHKFYNNLENSNINSNNNSNNKRTNEVNDKYSYSNISKETIIFILVLRKRYLFISKISYISNIYIYIYMSSKNKKQNEEMQNEEMQNAFTKLVDTFVKLSVHIDKSLNIDAKDLGIKDKNKLLKLIHLIFALGNNSSYIPGR